MPRSQSPPWRMWSACGVPTATGSPRISSALILRCPAPALPPETWESRQQASEYLSRGLQASVRDCCSWTKKGQQKAAQVVQELPDQPGTYLRLLRLTVTTPLSLSAVSESCSVVSNSLQPHGLYSPWNSPGQNIGVESSPLLQGILPTQGSNVSLPRCRQIHYQLSYQGSPWRQLVTVKRIFGRVMRQSMIEEGATEKEEKH